MAEVLAHLRARHPTSALYAAGWSQGGNVLINHLAASGDDCLLTAAFAVSPAMDPGAVLTLPTAPVRDPGAVD